VIGWLSGVVVEVAAEGLILDVHGVGYEVSLPPGLRGPDVRSGSPLALWVHTHASSESPASTLYGFVTSDERRVFRLLLKVKGIGPKLAQAIVAHLGARGVVEAVSSGDVRRLTTVSGVGKKIASQMMLDLAGQVASIEAALPQPGGPLFEVASALTNLGFRRAEVDRALKGLAERGEAEGSFDEVLRLALSLLREM
jgi:Holliday junction DNA helicase RuvA